MLVKSLVPPASGRLNEASKKNNQRNTESDLKERENKRGFCRGRAKRRGFRLTMDASYLLWGWLNWIMVCHVSNVNSSGKGFLTFNRTAHWAAGSSTVGVRTTFGAREVMLY